MSSRTFPRFGSWKDTESNVSASFLKRKKDRYNQQTNHMYDLSRGGSLQKGRRCSSENLNLSPKGYQSGSGQSERTSITELFTLLKERLL